jgi:hypothetical protein
MLQRTIDLLKTSTAEFKVPFSTNVNVHVRGGANGHARNGHVKKRAKPHMKNGLNQAACRAYGAVLLHLKCGFTIDHAIACTGSHTNYVVAMKWIVVSRDQYLLERVLRGRLDLFDMAEQVRPMVELKAAYKKLTPKQRITWAVEEDPNVLFEQVIAPAAAVHKTVMAEPTITDVT